MKINLKSRKRKTQPSKVDLLKARLYAFKQAYSVYQHLFDEVEREYMESRY